MPEDASLDQFASAETTDSEETGNETEDTGNETKGAEPEAATSEESEVRTEDATPEDGEAVPADADTAAVEPAVSTYAWSPEDSECADCGAAAGRLWRGEGQKGGGLVCPDCKEW